MLTAEDDKIRGVDIPERMQLSSTGLPNELGEDGSLLPYISDDLLPMAAEWMSTRIGAHRTEEFVLRGQDGQRPPLHGKFLESIEAVIRFMNVDFLEVPFIWRHRSDYLVAHQPDHPDERMRMVAFIHQDDLWKIQALSIKFRAFAHRRQELQTLFESLEAESAFFVDAFTSLESVEEVVDLHEWLTMTFAAKVAELKEQRELADVEAAQLKTKRAVKQSQYEFAKKTAVAKLASQAAIPATQLSQDFVAGTRSQSVEDPAQRPSELGDEFTGDGVYMSADSALSAAKLILVHELGRDPLLKKEVRRYFHDYGVVSVFPTEKGRHKLDPLQPAYAFKYLKEKPISLFQYSAQFLQILNAEAEDLVKSEVTLPTAAYDKLLQQLVKIYTSDYSSSVAEEWNQFRTEALEEALNKYLLPQAEVWTRGSIKDNEEEFVARLCTTKLNQRIDVAPFQRTDGTMERGEIPSVLALSHGQGDPKRDSVIGVFLDGEGHFREHIKIDQLYNGDPKQRDQFIELLRRRRPQVIVLGGFSPSTKTKLLPDLRNILDEVSQQIVIDQDDEGDDGEFLSPDARDARARFDAIFVHDEVARIYQNSPRAQAEFPELSKLGKFCVGLARYAQSPLNEYAAMGADLGTVMFEPDQKLLSKDKLQNSLERAMIEVVNKVGVDINRAIRNSYYYHLLPFVAGLGPRKANGLVKKIISAAGGTLTSRSNLLVKAILTRNVFMNASAFLRIPQHDLATDLRRNADDDGQADVLDDTRIHPENYEISRKMTADALELDEEDLADLTDKDPSAAVLKLMEDDPAKLNELSLDEFAAELTKMLGQPKRLALYAIRDEIQNPFAEVRGGFVEPSAFELFMMLSGEAPSTLERGMIIPVKVQRVRQDDGIQCRLDSGIEGLVGAGYRTENEGMYQKPAIGATIQAMVIEIHMDEFAVDLSTQERYIAEGDFNVRRTQPDTYWNHQAEHDEKEAQKATISKITGRTTRLIDHPLWRNFNAGQAEEALASGQRGDCIIRPSSKDDHLAVTWKVDDGIYQHIAVHELNKPDKLALGQILRVTHKYQYGDLDELVALHIKALARKTEEMLHHPKCQGTQDKLYTYLSNFTMANPGQSAYGYGLTKDRKLAGQFVVAFRANHNADTQAWPVKVTPDGYSLFGEDHGDITSLSNAFKLSYISRAGGGARQPTGRTPAHPGMGGRTPMPGGGRTPAVGNGQTPRPGMSSNPYAQQGGGRTPNAYAAGRATPGYGQGQTPYGGGQGAPVAAYAQQGARTPYDGGAGGRTPYGQPPPPPPPPGAPGVPGGVSGGGQTPYGGWGASQAPAQSQSTSGYGQGGANGGWGGW